MRCFTYKLLVTCLISLLLSYVTLAAVPLSSTLISSVIQQVPNDTTLNKKSLLKKTAADAIKQIKELKASYIDSKRVAMFPAVSLQQYLKAEVAGLYVEESTGEPGKPQSMFIRGTSRPLTSPQELFQTQPLVILDGVPLIAEHPFAYDIQRYQYERIGPQINSLANINMDNIESIEVLKNIGATAMYGPKAVNGVIILRSKSASVSRKINFESYVGMAQKTPVTTINAQFENNFRQQFYNKYTENGYSGANNNYPLYLSDSLNNAYHAAANWNDSYYKNGMVYGVNAGISGGNERANFRFGIGNLKNSGVADDTGLDRYNASFLVNMKPAKWSYFTAMINANQMVRQRNRSIRDRLTQVNYLPDLIAPLAPNKINYDQYINEFSKGFDNNKANLVQGVIKLGVDFNRFNFNTTLGADYSEGYRDIFFAKSLMQTTNYASNYFGYSQRLFIENTASYNLTVKDNHKFDFLLGNSIHFDTYKYNFAYAYKGSNDYIKLNLLHSNPSAGDYLSSYVYQNQLVYKFLDKTTNNLLSFNALVNYNYKDIYRLSFLLRADGSSNQQPTSRWFYSPALNFSWDLKKEFLSKDHLISGLTFRTSLGRLGRQESFDRYAQGPQYTAFNGFTDNLIIPGYDGFGTLTRPYTAGYINYNLDWAYQDQLDFGVDANFLNNRIKTSVDFYIKNDKNQLLAVPDGAEYGYASIIKNGMAIRNSGLDVAITADILPQQSKISWMSSVNLNYNKNKLRALPNGLSELVIGNRMLKVGESVDGYWLLGNNGIYNADEEVPVVNGQKMTFNGIILKAGDPKWTDLNRDNLINDSDKRIKGNALPIISGGFNNNFSYGNWSLALNIYFNMGRKLLNQEMANRFDFNNREGKNDIASVKEITFWEKRGVYANYPIYNPFSAVSPYQAGQDLFLENASFLKLRTVQLSYDLSKVLKSKFLELDRFLVYGSVNNVFTITKYTGQDPELVDYTGYDSGYGIQIPRTFLMGVKMQF